MKTLLAIGDKQDFDTYLKFCRNRRYFKRNGFLFKTIDYSSVLKNELPWINTNKIIIFLFFPFVYWDQYIEAKKDKAVYGNRTYYYKFQKFWKQVARIIENFYIGKDIYYINHPDCLSADRDKELTKELLSGAGVSVPASFATRDYKKIAVLLDKGKKIYIKVRFGSMGKGITYLEKDRWMTNFRFRGKKIISKKSDYGWTFQNITNNIAFLKKILKEDIIIEEAINPLLLKGRKYDLRMYVCFGKVLYIYPRSTQSRQVTTNISQGAKGEPQRFLKNISYRTLAAAKRDAVKALNALHLNFGGVDIMPKADGKNVTAIEINTFPGLPKSKSYNLSKDIINCIARQKWK